MAPTVRVLVGALVVFVSLSSSSAQDAKDKTTPCTCVSYQNCPVPSGLLGTRTLSATCSQPNFVCCPNNDDPATNPLVDSMGQHNSILGDILSLSRTKRQSYYYPISSWGSGRSRRRYYTTNPIRSWGSGGGRSMGYNPYNSWGSGGRRMMNSNAIGSWGSGRGRQVSSNPIMNWGSGGRTMATNPIMSWGSGGRTMATNPVMSWGSGSGRGRGMGTNPIEAW